MNITDDMIERAARGICEQTRISLKVKNAPLWENLNSQVLDFYIACARAALQAALNGQ